MVIYLVSSEYKITKIKLLKCTKSTILLPLYKYFLESNDEKAIKTPMKIAEENAEKYKESKTTKLRRE